MLAQGAVLKACFCSCVIYSHSLCVIQFQWDLLPSPKTLQRKLSVKKQQSSNYPSLSCQADPCQS